MNGLNQDDHMTDEEALRAVVNLTDERNQYDLENQLPTSVMPIEGVDWKSKEIESFKQERVFQGIPELEEKNFISLRQKGIKSSDIKFTSTLCVHIDGMWFGVLNSDGTLNMNVVERTLLLRDLRAKEDALKEEQLLFKCFKPFCGNEPISCWGIQLVKSDLWVIFIFLLGLVGSILGLISAITNHDAFGIYSNAFLMAFTLFGSVQGFVNTKLSTEENREKLKDVSEKIREIQEKHDALF